MFHAVQLIVRIVRSRVIKMELCPFPTLLTADSMEVFSHALPALEHKLVPIEHCARSSYQMRALDLGPAHSQPAE